MTMIAQQPSKPRATWPRFSRLLRRYQYEKAGAELLGLGQCPGAYLVLCTVELTLLGLLTRSAPGGTYAWWLALPWIAAVYYIGDALLVHTSIAYITRRPDYPLRSALLTFVAFLNIIHAFALLYVVHGHRFCFGRLTYPRALFYSVSTATTFGDDFKPGDDPVLLSFTALQLLVTAYFLAVIVAIVVNWSSTDKGEPA